MGSVHMRHGVTINHCGKSSFSGVHLLRCRCKVVREGARVGEEEEWAGSCMRGGEVVDKGTEGWVGGRGGG